MIHVLITEAAFSPEAEVARFSARRGASTGALATFVGYCRGGSEHGAVSQLQLDHYPGFTEAEVRGLAERTARRHGVDALLVVHRVGVVPAGEAIVLVAARSGHRVAAFAAVAELMDYLKTDAPFWKREVGPEGARWIEPTDQDRARRKAHGEQE
jgi:molybdopterin synthase catalytic subunit